MESNEYVVINKIELEDILYKYTRMANDQLFKGLATFLYSFEERFKEHSEELEYIKKLLKSEDNPLITFNDMGQGDKEKIIKVLQQAINQNQTNE